MTFIITFLLKKIEKFSIKKILIILLCFSLTFIFPFILEKYFDRSSGSVYARVYSIHYYLSEFAKRAVFGIGLLPDDKTNATIRIALHGEKEYANTTDIGIIGYLFQFGIVGILLLIWLTKYVIKEIRNCIYKDELYYIVVSCWIYIILSSSTLIVFDTQRIVMLPIILYFTFILNNKVNSNE